ncbi:cation-translocating P-type ATPase [Chloroflexota bacterium]
MNNQNTSSISNTWYQLSAAEVMHFLGVDQLGLTSDEAKSRLKKYGCNELVFKKRGPLKRFLLQFHSALVYVLLAAAAVTAFLGMWVDAGVIFAVVLVNTIIGFIQEGRAEASMEALKGMMVSICTVLRDGKQKDIPARELVPGDIAILEEGDRVPADLRLFYAKNLSVDEAMLTGESMPVEKNTEPIQKADLTPGDQRCMVFSGTFVARGTARGVVAATGEMTEIGKIARLMKEGPRAVSAPLVRKIAQFTKLIVIVTLVLAAINLLIGVFLGGYDMVYSFLASVSLAVAAIPEGLPAILTIALAAGARAMARRNALVRRLPAVETLGSTTVICSDKTGTLTRNEMTVVRIHAGNQDFKVSGVGYQPEGEFILKDLSVDPSQYSDLMDILRAGFLCNNTALEQTSEGYKISGDPTEGALVVSAAKAGIIGQDIRLDEMPFDSDQRFMATLNQGKDGNTIFVKGSPEKVMAMCKLQLSNGDAGLLDSEAILGKIDEMAGEALRVLGLAFKHVPVDKTSLSLNDLEDMVFLGLQGMIDPPREEAIEAVAKCKGAGIRVVMVTGDHAKTAQAVAHRLGIGNGGQVLTGEDLTKMSDEELFDVVDKVSIYARVAPVHKLRVVCQLQKKGNVVAVTGDGVNDAPALKTADLGIAMGIKGTEVTKETADMILVDDNFSSIIAAVEEGRHVFENIRKVILYTLPTNGGQALLVIGALLLLPFVPLFGHRLPLEPIQILWINLYDAVVLALPLLWEPREKGLLNRPPRNPREPVANQLFFRKVGLVSVLMAGAAFAVFYLYGTPAISGSEVDEIRLTQAQTAAFLTVMFVHIFYLLTARSLTTSAFRMSPFSNKWIIIGIAVTILLQLAIVYLPPYIGINPFRTAPIPANWWILIAAVALPGLFIVELEEFIVDRFKKRKQR